MKALKVILVLALLAALNRPVFADPENTLPCVVTINDLTRFADRYDNKLILLAGYCSLGFEQTAVFDTKEHLKFSRTEYGVWLNGLHTGCKIYDKTGKELESNFNFAGLPVIIEGVYNSLHKGHFSLYSGSIFSIKRITVFDDENELLINAAENLTVYVSNQSICLNPVDISVKIDNQTAISDTFDVKGKRVIQHNWIKYKFRIPSGEHTISVTSNIGEAGLERKISFSSLHFLNIEFHYSPDYKGAQKTRRFFQLLEDKKEFRFQ